MDKIIKKLSDMYIELNQIESDIYDSDKYLNAMVEDRIEIEDDLELASQLLIKVISRLKELE